MKIDRAIEILTHLEAATNSAPRRDCQEAYQLGIEALKCVAEIRHYPFPDGFLLLPGETKD